MNASDLDPTIQQFFWTFPVEAMMKSNNGPIMINPKRQVKRYDGNYDRHDYNNLTKGCG
jgi:hypothetical protein